MTQHEKDRFIVHDVKWSDLTRYFAGKPVCLCEAGDGTDEHDDEHCDLGSRPVGLELRQVLSDPNLEWCVRVIWERWPSREHGGATGPTGPTGSP